MTRKFAAADISPCPVSHRLAVICQRSFEVGRPAQITGAGAHYCRFGMENVEVGISCVKTNRADDITVIF